MKTFALRWLIFGLALCGLILGSPGQAPGPKIDQPGVFSYDAPPGWTSTVSNASKFRVAVGPRHDEFTPNINVVSASVAGSITEYAEGNKRALETAGIFEVTILEERSFTGAGGRESHRLVATVKRGNVVLRQVSYYFAGSGDRKYVVTCSDLAATGDKLLPAWDAAMKTFVPE